MTLNLPLNVLEEQLRGCCGASGVYVLCWIRIFVSSNRWAELYLSTIGLRSVSLNSMVTKQWNCIYFWSAENQKWHFEIQVMVHLRQNVHFNDGRRAKNWTKVFVKRNLAWLERGQLVHINMSQLILNVKLCTIRNFHFPFLGWSLIKVTHYSEYWC